MLANAILKIKTEIEQYKNDPYIKIVGDFLTGYVDSHPEAAEKIMNADKTIAKSIDAMAAEAKKKAKNGRSMLTDQEGFEIVLKYFGIEAEGPTASVEAKNSESASFSIKLEDLY